MATISKRLDLGPDFIDGTMKDPRTGRERVVLDETGKPANFAPSRNLNYLDFERQMRDQLDGLRRAESHFNRG